MRLNDLKYAFVFAVLAAVAQVASASAFVCSETVNSQASVTVEQFPATLSYDLTVTEAWCVYCAGQPENDWCHTLCPGGQPSGTYSVLETQSDGILAAFSGAPIPWAAAVPFVLTNGADVTTNVTFTLGSYADCAQRAAAAGIAPDAATGLIVITDLFRITWSSQGAPPYFAECSVPVTCLPPQGPTRTIGYFRTHPAAVAACVASPVNLGFMTVAAGNANAALGLLGANPARYDDGTKRSTLDQARILLGRQLLAAICNDRLFGSSPADPELVGAAQAALASGTCTNLSWLQGQLDAFNNSGDTGENYFGSAAPGSYPDPTFPSGLGCN